MGEKILKGYATPIANKALVVSDHTGPTSYTTGGEIVPGGGNPVQVFGLRSVDLLIPEALTVSGTYEVRSVSLVGSAASNQTGKLKWNYAPMNASPSGVALSQAAAPAGASTTVGVTSGLITVTQPNALVAGQFVLYKSTGAGAAFSGEILQVASASATQWTANYPTPNITAATADVTITYQVVQAAANNPLQTGASYAITNSLATSSLLTMTITNPAGGHTLVPGDFVIIGGASGNLTNGANANGVIVQVLTANTTTFTANWTGTSFSTGADTGTARLLVTNGSAPITATGTTTASITNSVATASSAGTAGVATLTANNTWVPGNIVVVQGLTNGAALNGQVFTVISTSLTSAAFKANGKMAAVSTGADSGTAAILATGPSPLSGEVPAGTNLSGETVRIVVIGN